MRQTLSLMIMEGPDEKIAVEIYKDGPKALDAFSNLKGQPGDKPSRATFLHLDQDANTVIHFETKNLPILKNMEEEPWGHKLGEGPIDEPAPPVDVSVETGHPFNCPCVLCDKVRDEIKRKQAE